MTARALPAIFMGWVVLVACGGGKAKYPAPVYEDPELPAWEPATPKEEDPFADLGAMEGEWVQDSGTDGAEEDEPETPADGEPDHESTALGGDRSPGEPAGPARAPADSGETAPGSGDIEAETTESSAPEGEE